MSRRSFDKSSIARLNNGVVRPDLVLEWSWVDYFKRLLLDKTTFSKKETLQLANSAAFIIRWWILVVLLQLTLVAMYG